MAGTPIGKIDCQITATGANGNQEFFKNLYDFFEQMVTANYATRIALQWGLSGTGTDYHDGTNPFGENAFVVYRMDGATSGNTASDRDDTTLPDFDYYFLIQWNDLSIPGASPGNPGALDGSVSTSTDGVGIVMAVREDGGSPWNGTTANDGTDTKGSTVWVPGGSTVHVMPISNERVNGVFVTNKQDTRKVADITTTTRVHLIGTADSVIFLVDPSDNNAYVGHYFGVYYPLTGLSPSLPICAVSTLTALPWSTALTSFWPPINTSTYPGGRSLEGGVLGADLADGMTSLSVGTNVQGVFQTEQPNTELATAELDAFPVRIIQRGNHTGYVGNLESGLVEVVYNVDTEATNAALTTAYFASTTKLAIHLSVPWDGTTTPGTTATRVGVTF